MKVLTIKESQLLKLVQMVSLLQEEISTDDLDSQRRLKEIYFVLEDIMNQDLEPILEQERKLSFTRGYELAEEQRRSAKRGRG